ncbi:MAG TPA: bifunctional adenosylcobinamide kinase/adenosylcobinamide-phosphate guanylyltransferase [Streptosporangiaceae bacterium]|nr:bifunctional adenosylcobinamide kinase/adenosylcobinamide-phosphate guanylyltransferase [Streptosporangiaceae bacterium]
MDVQFLGTGGLAGWPQAGCRCASCMRAAAAGRGRRPGGVLVDGRLRIDPGQPLQPATGYRIERLPGGWDITGRDGARLLVAAAPGAAPGPPAGTRPFDLVLLDLLGSAAQLGALRAGGLVRADTVAVALCADHRISSEPELARRCRLWRAVVPADGTTLSTSGRAEDGIAVDGAEDGIAVIPHRTLVLGGARSGKSREAELRLAAEPQVTYLAAGPWPDGAQAGSPGGPDADWALRVAAHRAARPSWWPTVESTDVAGALRRLRGAVLIDGIGTWLAAVMTEAGAWDEPAAAGAGDRIAARVDELITAWRQASARVVAVSDEVGAGVVPATAAGRQFRDQLGWLNQRLAAESEETVLVVAGRVLSLPT